MDSPAHVPVLLDRVVALLAPSLQDEGSVMVDATLGLGGHTEAVLTRCELARVVGIDRDPAALDLARQRLAGFGDRFRGGHGGGGGRGSVPGSAGCMRCITSCPPSPTSSASTRSTPSCSTSGSPPCSSTSASAASPTPRTRRSTCGWTAAPAPPRATCSTPTRPRSSPAS